MSDASDIDRYRARYVVSGCEVLTDAVVEVEDGSIAGVESDVPASDDGVRDLGDAAVVGGRVNAHSHAFQRAIRGRTEYLEPGRAEDDFWSWRERMYGAALALDPDAFERVARFAFLEMLRAGFTTVGEFHYVHHDRDGEPYEDPNELSKRVCSAAERVGIDLTLLRAAYHRGGYDTASNPRQRRFVESDAETYLERVEHLRKWMNSREWRTDMKVGLAPHSIRAVPGEWFEPIAEFAARRDLPVHIHASEQPGELEESRAEYGTTPIAALDELGLLSKRTAVVHATHATDSELDVLEERGCSVCGCPTTERNLGDGFLPADALVEREVPVCLGTDSHADIDPWEEMRLVEYHERLRAQRRNVLARHDSADVGTDRRETARVLWPMAGRHGARALRRDPPRLESGDPANFVAIDLDAVGLAGVSAQSLLSHLAFSTSPGAVREVFVRGEPVVRDFAHPDEEEIRGEFVDVMRRVCDA